MNNSRTLTFGKALRLVRKVRGVSQEALDAVSGRTYVSRLERGLSVPTLEKVVSLAEPLGVHPLTLMTLSFCEGLDEHQVENLLQRVHTEFVGLRSAVTPSDA